MVDAEIQHCAGQQRVVTLHSCATQKKKNAEHTHMHTIFRNFITQYSRRLLSILARHNSNLNKTFEWVLFSFSKSLTLRNHITLNNDLYKKAQRKKNAEHTRMYTIFRAPLSQYSRRLLSILAQKTF